MSYSLSKVAVAALAAVASVSAHTTFTTLWVDGVSQGDGTCVRMSHDNEKATFPVLDIEGNDMGCGYYGDQGVSRVCAANGGSVLSLEWRDKPDVTDSQAIDPGHWGPLSVYMKKVDDATTDPGYGDGWFKIWDKGYDESTGKWANEWLDDVGGKIDVEIPPVLEGGYYLVRPEILALHNDSDGKNPQFYTGCAQLFLDSDGTAAPSETVSIPGYVKWGDEPVNYNVYATPLSLPYPIPGPDVATLASSSSKRSLGKRLVQTQGLAPANCVLTNANWCGVELASYSDEAGCWNASSTCWDQDKACYDAAPPSGNANCKIWEDKCNTLMAQCNAGNFNGPPSKGEDLTPKPSSISLSALPATYIGSSVVRLATGVPSVAVSASSSSEAPASAEAPASTTTTQAPASVAYSHSASSATPTTLITSQAPSASSEEAASEAPATTAAPPPPTDNSGVVYVTDYDTDVVTDIVYVTQYVNGKRHLDHHKRHARQF